MIYIIYITYWFFIIWIVISDSNIITDEITVIFIDFNF